MSDSNEWTVGRLLTWTTDYLKQHGAASPRLDAEVLLAAARGCQRIELYTAFDQIADEATRTMFRDSVRRRAAAHGIAEHRPRGLVGDLVKSRVQLDALTAPSGSQQHFGVQPGTGRPVLFQVVRRPRQQASDGPFIRVRHDVNPRGPASRGFLGGRIRSADR